MINSPDFDVIVKFKNLEELYIADTRIRNEGIEKLCELKKLTDLNISGNHWLDDIAFQKLQGSSVKRLLATRLPRQTDKSSKANRGWN
jgi:Leucine-rich repeat (LRR) protein